MVGIAMQIFHLFVCFQIYQIAALSSLVRPLQGPIETCFTFLNNISTFYLEHFLLAESFQSIVNVI